MITTEVKDTERETCIKLWSITHLGSESEFKQCKCPRSGMAHSERAFCKLSFPYGNAHKDKTSISHNMNSFCIHVNLFFSHIALYTNHLELEINADRAKNGFAVW